MRQAASSKRARTAPLLSPYLQGLGIQGCTGVFRAKESVLHVWMCVFRLDLVFFGIRPLVPQWALGYENLRDCVQQ